VAVTLKSNLELHVDVLRTLACHGPMYSSNFEAEAKPDSFTLKKQLEFLIQNRLVEKQAATRKQALYVITEQGQKMLELFQKIADVFKLGNQDPPKKR
jgi:predicted transcriptional regulator